MGLRGILSSSKSQQQAEEFFLQNGAELLLQRIAISNGWGDIPIRIFTEKELVKATNNFAKSSVFHKDESLMVIGHFEGRQILVNYWTAGRSIPRYEGIHDIAIASHLSHLKNVLKVIGCCLELDIPACVYEYSESNKLLSDLLKPGNNNVGLSWKSRIKIARDIASTIVYLHTGFSTPVIHRNIKPSKVMIDQNGVAKLFDFTISISLPPGKVSVQDDIKGTLGFLDPDYMWSGFVTEKSDVYSFGVVLLMLVTGKKAVLDSPEGVKVRVSEYVKHQAENHQYDQVIDPKILENGECDSDDGLFRSLLHLGLMCTKDKGEDRPNMIDVAKELRLMEKGILHPLQSTNF